MILNDNEIKNCIKNKKIHIENFDEGQIQPASYDLRVGNQAVTTSSGEVVNLEEKGFIELKPGDFAVVMVKEFVEFDLCHTARIGLCSNYARKGIVAAIGPQIDPGYKGCLKIGLTNLSPNKTSIVYKADFITMEIHKLTKPSTKGYKGKNQDIYRLSQEDITSVVEGKNMGFSTLIEDMSQMSKSVGKLSETMNSLAKTQNVVQWVLSFMFGALLFIIGKLMFT